MQEWAGIPNVLGTIKRTILIQKNSRKISKSILITILRTITEKNQSITHRSMNTRMKTCSFIIVRYQKVMDRIRILLISIPQALILFFHYYLFLVFLVFSLIKRQISIVFYSHCRLKNDRFSVKKRFSYLHRSVSL